MLAPVAVLTTSTAVAAEAAHQLTGSSLVALVGGIAAFIIALGVIARALHLPEIRRGLRTFLSDWNGAPARPGVAKVSSFPERMDKVERRTELLQHNFSTEVMNRLVLLAEDLDLIKESATENGAAIGRLDYRVNGLDQRVTSHRDRNDQTIQDLGEHLLERIDALREDVENGRVDRQVLEAAVAMLTELGFPIVPESPGDHA